MRKFIDRVLVAVGFCSIVTLICGIIYGGYWVAKTFSYNFFYRDMVERTVIQEVKTSCLKRSE